jgi:hypothetical protein
VFGSEAWGVYSSEMTTLFVLLVLAAIVKLMLVTVFAGVRYQRRHESQKIAIGFTGDPVPPSTGSGANVIANS